MSKKKEYNGAGIYGLYNVVENKIYIGASKHIRTRFTQHRSNFKRCSDFNPMYKEPVENFIFLVLRKMTDREFKKYGKLLEELYITLAKHKFIPVYNLVCVDTAIYAAFDAFDMYSDIDNAVIEAISKTPGQIRVNGKASRKAICEKYWENRGFNY